MGIFNNNSDQTLPSDGAPIVPSIEPQSTDGILASSPAAPAPVAADATATASPAPADYIVTDAPAPMTTPAGNDDLAVIKQKALQQLSPLVGHLDQTPEEKFRTTMMMLQATDDQSLISVAYEAAQGIADDKVKAQALLDIVNEINYFSQQKTA